MATKISPHKPQSALNNIQPGLPVAPCKLPVFIFLLLLSITAFSQKDSNVVGQLTELSLDDLSNLTVITASGSEQKISEAPSTMTVITAEQIKERGYEQLEDALRDVQGIDLIHLSGYAPTIIYFRGMYGAENLRALLMIDGVPENNIAGSIDLAGPAYSLHNVQRIEIIWGPASALYGANAFGGVINIITEKGADINGAYYEKGFGTFNATSEKAMLGVKKNNFDVSFSGSLYSTDGPSYTNRDPYYTGAFVDKAWSFDANVIHTYKKFKTTVAFRAFDSPMSWGNLLNSATKALNLPSQGNGNRGNIGILQEDVRNERPGVNETYSYTSFIQTEFTASAKLSFLARITYRETGIGDRSYVYLSIDSAIYTKDKSGNNTNTLALDTSHIYRIPVYSYSNRAKAELSANYIASKEHKFYAGTVFYQDNVENGNRGETLDTNKYVIDGIPVINLYPTIKDRLYTLRNNFGGFIQYVFASSFLRSTNITVGGRYDVNTDYTSPFSPHIAIVNKPDDQTTIKLMFGTAFRSPTVSEVAAQIAANGSKAVNPEKVNTFEINLIRNLSPKVVVQVNGFDNELSDIFVLNSLIGGGLGAKQTLGKASIQGAEARLDVFASKDFSLFLNYTYQKGTQTDVLSGLKFNIPDLPNHKGNVGITYRIQDLFTLSAISNWVGQRELPMSNPYGADKGYKMDGYFVTNVVLTSRHFYENRISASIDVRNVFNANYLDPGLRTADGTLYSTVLEQPGRSVFFKIAITL